MPKKIKLFFSILIIIVLQLISFIVGSFEQDLSQKPHLQPGLLWKFNAGNLITTPATITSEYLFFGTIDGKLYALKKVDGTIKWNIETGGAIRSTPVINDGLVYFGSCDQNFYAVDIRSGSVIWRFLSDREIESSPVVSGQLVYFTSVDGHLYALDKKLGVEKWRFRTGGCILSSPTVSDGIVLFGSWDTVFYAIDSSSGKEKWRFKTNGIINSNPVISGDTVVFGSDDNTIYSLDINTGRLRWKKSIRRSLRGKPCTIGNLLVYVVHHSPTKEHHKGPALYILDMNNHNIIWKSKSQLVDPISHNNIIYFSSVENEDEWTVAYVYSIDIKTKKINWKFHIGACAFSVDKNMLYIVGCDSTIYSVDTHQAEKVYLLKHSSNDN